MRSIKQTIKMVKGLSYDTLQFIKYALITFVFIDMFLIWWYMGWKKAAMVLFLVTAVFLVIILLLERRLNNMEDEEQETKEEKEEDKKETPKEEGFTLGLPSPEEYNKRLDQALGTGF